VARSTNRAPVDILESVIGSNLTVAGCKQHPKIEVVSDQKPGGRICHTFIKLICHNFPFTKPQLWYCTSRFRDVQMPGKNPLHTGTQILQTPPLPVWQDLRTTRPEDSLPSGQSADVSLPLSGTVNDLKNAAQTSLRKGFLSCLGPGFKLDVVEYVFFPIGSVTFPTSLSLSHSLSLSLWIFGNLQRKSQVWTRRTTFGLRGASRFPPDLRGWLNQQQPTTNGGSPKGGLPKSTP
jgi:hypothetical protein